MRPALKAGLLPVWRDRDTLQIGIDPRRAVALTGMAGVSELLSLLDGSRDREQVLAAARARGIPAEAADRVIALLAAGGALHDIPAAGTQVVPAARRRRLAPELAAAALAYGAGDGGARILARREAAWVLVHGTSPVGLSVASLLAAAGLGRVSVAGPVTATGPVSAEGPVTATGPVTAEGPVTATGTASPSPPGGPGRAPAAGPGTGTGRGLRPWPGVPVRPAPGGGYPQERPDLVVLADCHQPEVAAALMAAAVPHLAVSAGEAIGTVGPLVTPGNSACLRCLDLTRAERDPAWPMILAQRAGREPDPPACGTIMAAAVAAQAAAQALAFVDGAAAGVVTNGTLELVLPDWQWHRRSWRPHRGCGCGSRAAS